MGSVGFIVSVIVCGWVFEGFGVSYFPYTLLVLILLIFLVSLFHYKEVSIQPMQKIEGPLFFEQLKQPWVLSFFVVCFLLQVSHGAYYTYFSVYLSALEYSKKPDWVVVGTWRGC